MNTKNEVFEYLIDQLRQQVNNNRCEDLAREVQSLKNQLRDASAQIKELHMALVKATGDAEAYKLIRAQEQSGCRKDDTQECKHEWRTETLYGVRVVPTYCRKCGVYKQKDEKNDTQECEHEWSSYYDGGLTMRRLCGKCGAKK